MLNGSLLKGGINYDLRRIGDLISKIIYSFPYLEKFE
jgi:hypothetical protein